MRAATASARHEESSMRVPEAEDAVRVAGAAVADARRGQAEAEQALRLAEADKGHAQRALENLTQRQTRLEADRQALGAPDPALVAASREAEAMAEEQLALAQDRLAQLQASLPEAEARLRSAREALQAAHRSVTETRARHEALSALQAKVAQSGDMGSWLRERGLSEAKPLWQSIQVEAGWETAVESVLRERFSALFADESVVRGALHGKAPGIVMLAMPASGHAMSVAGSLRGKVICSDTRWNAALDEWLAGVDVAVDLAAAVPLEAGVRVSRDGHLLTPHGLTLYVPDAKTHGVIERQREIDELAAQMESRMLAEDEARERQHEAEQSLTALQADLAGARRGAQEAQQRNHAAQVEALKLAQAQARFEERSAQIDVDLADIARQQSTEEARRERAETDAELQRERLGEVRMQVDEAQERQRQRDAALRDARALEQQMAREAQEAGFSERECVSKLEDNHRATETASSQLDRIVTEFDMAQLEVASISDDVLQEQLYSALDAKQAQESALAARRDVLETAAAELRTLDEQRLRLEHSIDPLREKINDLKLKAQAAQLNDEQYVVRLAEVNVLTEADELPFADDLAEGRRDSVLQAEITRASNEIEALGPVNLTALDELTTARERKGFLDAQSKDLADAIGTLQDAIRRIDRETREQLQDTYDKVNTQFGSLFPQLFGGGEAKLILTGEEILDAGISIMAQPPGKKNSTIHLLSGGEKALTAIALVFALFQLNPAPFCMLDEVDAPLDDSNTVRFCEMVKKMSVNTQFIFISHNKIAMEMAQQLIGVTMQEQGVSRVVEVDISEALRLADSKVAA